MCQEEGCSGTHNERWKHKACDQSHPSSCQHWAVLLCGVNGHHPIIDSWIHLLMHARAWQCRTPEQQSWLYGHLLSFSIVATPWCMKNIERSMPMLCNQARGLSDIVMQAPCLTTMTCQDKIHCESLLRNNLDLCSSL